MRISPSFFPSAGRFLLFAVLEVFCIVLISRNGIVQRYGVFEKIRAVQAFFWEKEMNLRTYSRLREINRQLADDNARLLQQVETYRESLTGYPELRSGNPGGRSDAADTATAADTAADTAANTASDSPGHLPEGIRTAGPAEGGSALADFPAGTVLPPLQGQTFGYTWARIIKNKLNSLHNYVILNRGRADGLSEDMGVVTPCGVVGIIRAVGKHNAFVLSFFNIDQSVSARIGKSRALGTLVWDKTSPDGALLNEIPSHTEVVPGDTVYTSGYSSLYPPDIPLGVAQESRIVNGTHRSVTVKLFQDPRKLEYAAVVINNYRREIDSLSRTASRQP